MNTLFADEIDQATALRRMAKSRRLGGIMTVHVVPIEPLDQRYTVQWARWFKDEFKRLNVAAEFYEPKRLHDYDRIEHGQFLDVVKTNAYKAAQLSMLCAAITEGKIKSGDTIFFHDLWFPGLEMLFYIRDGLDMDLHIVGVVHAGTYDPHDFLSHCGMARWAQTFERGWFSEVDCIFLSCAFHKELLSSRLETTANVCVSGLPMLSKDYDQAQTVAMREDIIVFPHRLAPEKQPHLFDRAREGAAPALRGFQWIKTQEVQRNKAEYLDLLARSKVAVSAALQETWGIGMQEAAYMGCIPIVPARLAYMDIYPPEYRYESQSEMTAKIQWAATNYEDIVNSHLHVRWLKGLKQHNNGAIERMVDHLSYK